MHGNAYYFETCCSCVGGSSRVGGSSEEPGPGKIEAEERRGRSRIEKRSRSEEVHPFQLPPADSDSGSDEECESCTRMDTFEKHDSALASTMDKASSAQSQDTKGPCLVRAQSSEVQRRKRSSNVSKAILELIGSDSSSFDSDDNLGKLDDDPPDDIDRLLADLDRDDMVPAGRERSTQKVAISEDVVFHDF